MNVICLDCLHFFEIRQEETKVICPTCGMQLDHDGTGRLSRSRIELPYKYKSVHGAEYQILGWEGEVLKTKDPSGRVWILDAKLTKELLTYLCLKKESIPK